MTTISSDILEGIGQVVDAKINGKLVEIKNTIDARTKTLNEIQETLVEHTQKLDTLLPILQVTAGGKALYKVFMVVGSIAVAWIALKQTLHL